MHTLLADPSAVAASGIDSPADYLPGFKTDPPALFGLLAQIPGYIDVLDNFYIGHYGSIEAAAQQSLGTQLAAQGIETPIYLAYSAKDTFTTNGITAPLVQALQARQPAARARVWNSGERGRVGQWRGPGFVTMSSHGSRMRMLTAVPTHCRRC